MATAIVLFGIFVYILWAPEEYGRLIAKARKAYDREMKRNGRDG